LDDHVARIKRNYKSEIILWIFFSQIFLAQSQRAIKCPLQGSAAEIYASECTCARSTHGADGTWPRCNRYPISVSIGDSVTVGHGNSWSRNNRSYRACIAIAWNARDARECHARTCVAATRVGRGAKWRNVTFSMNVFKSCGGPLITPGTY